MSNTESPPPASRLRQAQVTLTKGQLDGLADDVCRNIGIMFDSTLILADLSVCDAITHTIRFSYPEWCIYARIHARYHYMKKVRQSAKNKSVGRGRPIST